MRRSSKSLSFFMSNVTPNISKENHIANSDPSYINQVGKMLLLTLSSLGLSWGISGFFDNRSSTSEAQNTDGLTIGVNTATVLFPITLGIMLSQYRAPGYHSIASLGAVSLATLPTVEAAWNPSKELGNLIKGPSDVLGNILKKIFSPADYFMPNDSIKELIEKTRSEGKQLVWEAGKEVRLTVEETGKEAKAIIEQTGNEANKLVAHFGDEGKLLIEKTGEEFRVTADDVLKKTFNGAEATLQIAGQEARMTILGVRVAVQETGKILYGVVEKIEQASNELVINMGNEARISIAKAGEEFRFSVDQALEKTFEGSQLTLGVAGIESRLTIHKMEQAVTDATQKIGFELRSVITHAGNEYRAISYEIPRLARIGAESIVAGFIEEAKHQLWETELGLVRRKISNYVRENPKASFERLLEYVQDGNNLVHQDKAQLYLDLINYVTVPDQPRETRNQLSLIIGIVALNDAKLYEYVDWGITSYTRNYTQPILNVLPSEVQSALVEKDETKILGFFGLLPAPNIEPDGSVPIGTIVAFPSHIVPEDFVECDGKEYLVSDFPELYSVIGKRYGYRIDSENKEYFNAPDYRGYFLRGWNGSDENGKEIFLGAKQEESTRMPHIPFQVEVAGNHNHKVEKSGEHIHAVEESGEHVHQTGYSGGHQHTIDSNGEHIHDMSNAGEHSHNIHGNGNHNHHMDMGGKHSHEVAHVLEWDKGGDYELGYNRARNDPNHKFSTKDSGEHNHYINYSGDHSHGMDQSGNHHHTVHNSGSHTHNMQISGEHTHEISVSGKHFHTIKSDGNHQHELTSSGEHTHTLSGGDKETRPKNVQVKFMIKYKSSARNLHQEIKELKEELEATRVKMTENHQAGFFYSTVATTLSVAAIITNTCTNYFRK